MSEEVKKIIFKALNNTAGEVCWGHGIDGDTFFAGVAEWLEEWTRKINE